MNDLALHLLDIVQNSLSAGASLISIRLEEHVTENLLKMIVEDNGRGMTQEQVQKLSDPFFTSRTTRRVGLGVPCCDKQQNRQEAVWRWNLSREKEPG